MLEWPYAEYYSDSNIINILRYITFNKIDEPLNTLSALYITYLSIKSININCNYYSPYLTICLLMIGFNGLVAAIAHSNITYSILIFIDGISMLFPIYVIIGYYLPSAKIKLWLLYNLIIAIMITMYTDYFTLYFSINILFIITLLYKKNKLVYKYPLGIITIAIIFRFIDSIYFPYGHSLWHIFAGYGFIDIIIKNSLLDFSEKQ